MINNNILVADDDAAVLSMIKAALEKEGYAITCVQDGAQALEAIEKAFFPLIILDVKMPKVDGIEVLKKIRETQQSDLHSTVIVVTGHPSEEVSIQAIKNRANDYIVKPFILDELIYSVNRNMHLVKLEAEKAEYANQIAKKNEELENALKELEKSKMSLENYSWTLEKMVEEELRSFQISQAQLIQSAKMAAVGQLGAGVAHELNNPLTAILGYIQLLGRMIKQPVFAAKDFNDCLQYLGYAENETLRCKEIVARLLQFSRKPLSTKLEPVDVKKAIEDLFFIINNNFKLKNVQVNTTFSPDLHKAIGSTNQLQQVFLNLFLNAQEAMPEGGTLAITAKNDISDKRHGAKVVCIEVSDTGCGIPKANFSRIFEPFFTTKDKDKGTGLGLFVTYQIIQEHEGNIEVKSEVGKGTTFIVTLPAAEDKV